VSGFYTPGTFQQYAISYAKYVTPIPTAITDLAGAAPIMCAGITLYAGLKRGGVKYGDWVLVSGAGGGLGHLGIQYAKALGAKVLAIDSAEKEKFCTSLGADVFLDFKQFDAGSLTAKIHEISGGGVKIALMCVNHQAVYDQAVYWLGFRGKLVVIGVPEGEMKPIASAAAGIFINNEGSIFGIKAGNRAEAKECLEIVAAGKVVPKYELRKMEELTQVRLPSSLGCVHPFTCST
jgi:propanol-preferring alcohol dehydrogenase